MKHFMQLAISESVKSVSNNGGPFGAVIVRNGKVISVGNNQVTKTDDPTAHAEIVAIRKASKKLKTFDLSDCEIYTSSYPCPMCLSAIIWAKIKKVYYYFDLDCAKDSEFCDKEIYNKMKGSKSKIKIDIKKLEFAIEEDPFVAWKKNKNKIKY